MKLMVAKYDGNCCQCSKPITAGQMIKFFGRGRASHQHCFAPNGPTPAGEVRGACWICGNPEGRFRNLGAATPVWCDGCNEKEQAKRKTVGNVVFNSREDYPCSDAGYEDACARACGM